MKNGNEIGKGTRFSRNNQPINNGRKRKSTTEYLREFGEATAIDYKITLTGKDGKDSVRKGKIESKSPLNQLLACILCSEAL